jgi:hypothetical protein
MKGSVTGSEGPIRKTSDRATQGGVRWMIQAKSTLPRTDWPLPNLEPIAALMGLGSGSY